MKRAGIHGTDPDARGRFLRIMALALLTSQDGEEQGKRRNIVCACDPRESQEEALTAIILGYSSDSGTVQ